MWFILNVTHTFGAPICAGCRSLIDNIVIILTVLSFLRQCLYILINYVLETKYISFDEQYTVNYFIRILKLKDVPIQLEDTL